MAHNVETMAYAGETPWHGLGTKVLPDLTPAQMQKEAGLDWSVDLQEVFTEINGKNVSLPKKALVRSSDNRVLDVVGNDWKPVQNDEAFEFFADFVRAGDMEMHTAGSLRDGQLTWALAKVKGGFELFGGDTVEPYLLFSNPFLYGKSIDIRFTPIRVVCNNTLDLSLGTAVANSYKQGHRVTFDPTKVKEALGVVTSKLDTYKEMAEFLGSKRYNGETLEEYLKLSFPVTGAKKEVSRNAVRAMEAIDSQPGANFAEGSWWSAFNVVTYMHDHELGRNADNRLSTSWFGTGRAKKVQALERAIEFAEAA